MKIAILNYIQECIDIVPVSEEEFTRYGGDLDKLEFGNSAGFDGDLFLSDRGYPLTEINWMFCGTDPDEIPVYYANEVIPCTVL